MAPEADRPCGPAGPSRRTRARFLIRACLAHPLTRGLPLDDPRTTLLRRRIVLEKVFLRRIYEEWYRALAAALPPGFSGPVLEIGSGPGFLERFIPGLIRSEVFHIPGVDVILDAAQIPFREGALRAIVMTDVLHHLTEPRRFFAEAARSVRPGGAIAMIEPWITPWSRLVYSRLHHELMDADATWGVPAGKLPLSAANSALPWIIFQRDRAQFEREFPEGRIAEIRPFMSFRYLLSGGVSLRSLMPGWSFGFWTRLEGALQRRMRFWAMFAVIRLERAGENRV
jgi:SAM-dependent methyltransferase